MNLRFDKFKSETHIRRVYVAKYKEHKKKLDNLDDDNKDRLYHFHYDYWLIQERIGRKNIGGFFEGDCGEKTSGQPQVSGTQA